MRIGRERAHNRWHPALEPVATVKPGDEITLDCEDGIGGQLTRESEHADAGRIDLGAAHPITGPVFVEGAEPGNALEVEFLAFGAVVVPAARDRTVVKVAGDHSLRSDRAAVEAAVGDWLNSLLRDSRAR